MELGGHRGAQGSGGSGEGEVGGGRQGAEHQQAIGAAGGEVEGACAGVDVAKEGEGSAGGEGEAAAVGAGEGAAKDQVGGDFAIRGIGIEAGGGHTGVDQGLFLGVAEVAGQEDIGVGCGREGDAAGRGDHALEHQGAGGEGGSASAVKFEQGATDGIQPANSGVGIEGQAAAAGGGDGTRGIDQQITGTGEAEVASGGSDGAIDREVAAAGADGGVAGGS